MSEENRVVDEAIAGDETIAELTAKLGDELLENGILHKVAEHLENHLDAAHDALIAIEYIAKTTDNPAYWSHNERGSFARLIAHIAYNARVVYPSPVSPVGKS